MLSTPPSTPTAENSPVLPTMLPHKGSSALRETVKEINIETLQHTDENDEGSVRSLRSGVPGPALARRLVDRRHPAMVVEICLSGRLSAPLGRGRRLQRRRPDGAAVRRTGLPGHVR